VFGDPHFITFDGAQTTFVGDQVIWLVHTESIWMQALSVHSQGKFLGFAVGGDFLQNHTLLVYKNHSAALPTEVLFDGQSILAGGAEDEFHQPGLLEAFRTAEWNSTLHDSEILRLRTEMKFAIVDEFKDRFLNRSAGGLLLFRLPGGAEVTLSGVDYMSAVLKLALPAGEQGGYCGNFNGNPDDDAEPVAPSWNRPLGTFLGPVSEDQNLFRGLKEHRMALLTAAGGPRPEEVLQTCAGEIRMDAEKRCEHVEDTRMKADCVFDICFTRILHAEDGDVSSEAVKEARAGAARDTLDAEDLAAWGIPLFMGHGRCLDSKGRRYAGFITLLETPKECQDALRDLKLVHGVLGAQLMEGSTCEVLLEPGVDPRATAAAAPRVGWSGVLGEVAAGHGIVRGTTSEASWSCWQLD